MLKVETPFGPSWHRYNEDGYGEHEDGSAFDGTGKGRAWPLLTGERAHYELAANHPNEALRLLHTIKSFANGVGLLPEQIWDTTDIPEKELIFGKPSGSAMPLVWAHAEYVKLLRSLHDNKVFDMPPQTVQRYIIEKQELPYTIWRFNHKCRTMHSGHTLRIEVLSSAVIHWSSDDWQTTNDTRTHDTGLGVHIADLPTNELSSGSALTFTIYWPDEDRWEGENQTILIRDLE